MDKRNILVILCDQLRPDFLSIYGGRGVPTPNLDRLAAQGVVFDNAITQSPVCGPARASMMTGRYVSDHGVWSNDIPFRDGLEYIAERMNELGYATAAFGKLHHTPGTDLKGFQYARQMEEGRLKDQEPYIQWLKERHPEIIRFQDFSVDGMFKYADEEYYEHWTASEAIRYLNESQDSSPEKPFFIWLSFQGPHTPFDPPSGVKGSCRTAELPKPLARPDMNARFPQVVQYRRAMAATNFPASLDDIMELRIRYAEMIVEIDRQIGRVLATLEQRKLLESTTIIFSADHGDLLGDFGLTQKGPFPYRGQLDIPLVIANHPDIQAGSRSQSLAGNIDIAGTALEIAGADRGIGVSRSLLDPAQAEPRHPREVNFAEFCDSTRIVEDRRYRYCYYPLSGEAELFDKQQDPDELVNLAGRTELAEVEARLLKHIIDFGVIAKGVHVECHDFVPEQQKGLRRKHPEYQRDFPVAFPPNRNEIKNFKSRGLPADYVEFCKGKEILVKYQQAYWEEES